MRRARKASSIYSWRIAAAIAAAANPDFRRHHQEIGRVAPAPLGPESVAKAAAATGHEVAFCVRLCDGQNFPLEHMGERRRSRPAAPCARRVKTKVFFGSEVGGAVAKDGARYADLDNAFIYRKQLVANCTCNGKDASGSRRSTQKPCAALRPGDDAVST